MDLNKIPIFNMMARRLNWLSQRQSVLAQNIANANTPGYKPQDLKELSFKSMVERSSSGRLGLAQTNGAHLTGTKNGEGKHRTVDADGFETAPSGNSVVLEEQLMKTGETRMNYMTTLNLYRKQVDMIKTALRSNR